MSNPTPSNAKGAADAQAEAPDMSEALEKQYRVGYDDGYQDGLVYKLGFSGPLEAEYQRGWADGARQQRAADKRNLANSVSFNAATALSGYPLVTATPTNAENCGEA